MTTRREFITAAAVAVGAARPLAAWSQTARPKKIGWLKIQDHDHTPGQLREFIGGLRALGLEEGRDFVMENRFADGDPSRLNALANELVQEKVDVILATSQPAT